MANVLNLAMKVTADSTGVVAPLTKAERALASLGTAADKSLKVLDEFAGGSKGAADAQARLAGEFDKLSKALGSGLNAQEYAKQFEALQRQVTATAKAFQDGARITEQTRTSDERRAAEIARLKELLRLGAIDQQTFNRAVEASSRDTKTAADNLGQMASSLRLIAGIEVGRVLFDGLQLVGSAARRVAGELTSVASSVNSSLDSLNDLSARTGIGVEALQGYSLAAKLAGVDTEQFGTAVQRLAVSIGKAAPGDALDKSLRAINLSVAQLRALSPEQQFSEIGNAISQLPTAADRAAAAVEIFGKQGAALAPLFREGAASIQELRAEGKQLGAIVSDQQLANIASMNDAFDKVNATVRGIIGQVLGNLAPAVTAVTEKIIEYIKVWEGTSTQGTGGTGIANAISEQLLNVADYFAGKFDQFAEYLSKFSVSLEETSSVFNTVANILTAVTEGVRTVFNLLQTGVAALTAGFGKVLEGIGSWVDSDLETFGRNLAETATAEANKQSRQMEDAAKKAAAAFNAALDGGTGSIEAAADGQASRFMDAVRERFNREQSPEFKVEANLDRAREQLDKYLKTAGDGADEFLVKSQAILEAFRKQVEQGELLPAQIKIMNGFMDDLNAKLGTELALRKEAAETAAKQAEEDRKRVDGLLKTNDVTDKIEQDLATVTREIQRAEEAQAAAREANDAAAANAAAARIAQLDQLQAQLEENLQAAEQGFSDGGFGPAFERINEQLGGLQEKALEFGAAGQEAFLRLQEGVAAAQQQARDGILNKEALQQQVAAQQKAFEQELKNIDDVARAKAKAAEDAVKAEEKARQDALKAQEDQQKAIAQAQQQAQQQYEQEQKRIFEERQKAEKAEYDRQVKRLTELNTLGSRTVQTADVRTQEGAALVLGLAAEAQDPRLIEARLQSKLQRQMVNALAANLQRIGVPVFLP